MVFPQISCTDLVNRGRGGGVHIHISRFRPINSFEINYKHFAKHACDFSLILLEPCNFLFLSSQVVEVRNVFVCT